MNASATRRQPAPTPTPTPTLPRKRGRESTRPPPVSPSPPLGAERAGLRWGMPERLPIPTSPSQRFALGPSLSPLKGGEGFLAATGERIPSAIHNVAA